MTDEPDSSPPSVAIIGLAGRFPGARDVHAFWRNLRDGVESISFFAPEELERSLVDGDAADGDGFVRARGILEAPESFDAGFFGYSHREAEVIDPQQRVFLECAWEALEDAGYDPAACDARIGVYAGTSINRYLLNNLLLNREVLSGVGSMQVLFGSAADFLATRVSYKLDLKGPSLTVQTACSTSLVGVHLACQALLNGECDMALAGGVTIRVPQRAGYLYQPGGIASPDGHCRAFDAQARGTVFSNGVGIVTLKRLEDAVADGDAVRAVIRGSAVNNDGAAKIGFTAPSVDSQAEVVAEALAVAGVDPETISYVEAHGTGTELGDPIEVAALTRAFRTGTERRGFCALGSVKTNVGHLDAAAGAAGLIKTVLALEHGQIPPSLHFEEPNPELDLEESPFYVNAALAPWPNGDGPRRAGVSSLGVGGTNVHVVLEEAPPRPAAAPSRPWELLVLSARSDAALDRAAAHLAHHLRDRPEACLADVAFTLEQGRRAFAHRRAVVCRDPREAASLLAGDDPSRVATAALDPAARAAPGVVFMFPGQGTQHPGMGAELYRHESVFREQVDACAELLEPELGLDLRRLIDPPSGDEDEAARQLAATRVTQPALFTVEYALARLWMEWGIRPAAMIGHSIGEYVAACLAGVLDLEDALALVAARGRLMQELPAGAMLAVPLPPDELEPLLGKKLSLAAVNAPGRSVVSGTQTAAARLAKRLERQGTVCRPLHTSHAFHSAMMDPVVEPFVERVAEVRLRAPEIPYVSNLTGTWITAAEATDPEYYGRHLRRTVRFADGLAEVLAEPSRLLLEVGPGTATSTLARRHPDRRPEQWVISSLGPSQDAGSDLRSVLETLGRLWLRGAPVDWPRFRAGQRRSRVPLPTYPFERRRYWIEAPGVVPQVAAAPRDEEPETLLRGPILARPVHPRSLPTPFVAPASPAEEALAELWQDLLGVDQVGTHDNFFELGGDSMVGLQMVIQARSAGLELAINQLLEHQTIAELAATAGAVEEAAEEAADVPDAEDVYPLSPVQEDLLAHELGHPRQSASVEQLSCRLRGDVDLATFRAAWYKVIARHPALRSLVRAGEDPPRQEVRQRITLPWREEDWRTLGEDERQARLSALLLDELNAGFDLSRPPPIRLAMVRVAADLTYCVWTYHRVLVDVWSTAVVLREVFASYEVLYRGGEPDLRPVPPYRDFVAWLRRHDPAPGEDFWRRHLAGLTRPTPLGIGGGPAAGTWVPAHQVRALSDDETAAVRATARDHQIASGTVFKGIWALLLSRTSGEPEVVFGSAEAGRPTDLPGSDAIVGSFSCVLPQRVRIDPETSVLDWLRDLQARQQEIKHHELTPLAKIRELSELPEGTPLFESLLAFESVPRRAAYVGDRDRQMLQIEDPREFKCTPYPLTVRVMPGYVITVGISCDPRRFEPPVVTRVLDDYHELLVVTLADLRQPIGSLSLAPAS